MDYRRAGVDLAAADRLVEWIGPVVTSTWGPDVISRFGGFAAGLRIPEGYARPVLMLTTDSVGTKAEVARLAGRYQGLGWDLAAMNLDDLAAAGARPLAMVDYLAVGRIDLQRDRTLVESVAAACAEAGCALLGGETAEHPGVIEPDRFDLAGAALGVVEEGKEIDGSAIRPGDRIVGVASPNLRSNGFSLVRSAVLPRLGLDEPFPGSHRSVAEVLLEPSVIYAPAVHDLVQVVPVHGLAHVTGGGLPGNLVRVLPDRCRASIDVESWEVPDVFGLVARLGEVARGEMYRTFNMGIGFVVVVAAAATADALGALGDSGHTAWAIGEIVEGEREVELAGVR